jgi:hypothetical protein
MDMSEELHSYEDAKVLPTVSLPMAFDLSSLAYLQTAELTVRHPISDEPTTWRITFAGPGHPVTVALGDEIARRSIEQRQTREEAMTNGRKWKAPAETPAKNRRENALNMAKRILDWTPVVLQAGMPELEYSPEAATSILSNPDFGWLYEQVRKFLNDDAGFIKTSALN